MNKVHMHVNTLYGTLILQFLANATNVEKNFLANETLGTILIKCTNFFFGKMIYKLLANVENNYLANETLKNHMNVNIANIHLPKTVNLKNTLNINITSS